MRVKQSVGDACGTSLSHRVKGPRGLVLGGCEGMSSYYSGVMVVKLSLRGTFREGYTRATEGTTEYLGAMLTCVHSR